MIKVNIEKCLKIGIYFILAMGVVIAFGLYFYVNHKTKIVFNKMLIEVDSLSIRVKQQADQYPTIDQMANDAVTNLAGDAQPNIGVSISNSNKIEMSDDNKIGMSDDWKHDLLHLKDRLFDANIVTFLLSFAIALLIMLIVRQTDKIEKINSEVESAVKKINSKVESDFEEINSKVESAIKKINSEVESAVRRIIFQKEFTRINTLTSQGSLLWYALVVKEYVLTAEALNIIAQMDREVKSLLKEIPLNPSNGSVILREAEKRRLIEVIGDIKGLYKIHLLEKKAENSNRLSPIQLLDKHLKDLETRIYAIKSIDSTNSSTQS
ncbi:MAG: hypothetical protein LBN06_10465 [Prevotellaceae bacterium]|jgi:ribosomal protein S20|nr:hypothetical protein [Prevotellaceae bacterium]